MGRGIKIAGAGAVAALTLTALPTSEITPGSDRIATVRTVGLNPDNPNQATIHEQQSGKSVLLATVQCEDGQASLAPEANKFVSFDESFLRKIGNIPANTNFCTDSGINIPAVEALLGELSIPPA
jgi:Flp pilus assembly protein TadG